MLMPPRVKPRRPDKQLLLWLIPVGVALSVLVLSTKTLTDLIGLAVAAPVLLFLVRRPGGTLLALIIFLPFELIGFALLLRWHVPASLLRPASGIKELMVLALVLAAIGHIRSTGRRLDRIDAAVLAYVAVVTLWLAAPHLFSATAPTNLSTRVLAWRTDAGYPLLFFGARHAPIPPRVKEQYMKVLLVIGGIVAVLAVFQRLDANGWSSFVLHTANVPKYETNVLDLSPLDAYNNLAYLLPSTSLRVSSIFLSPFDMGDYLVLATAVAAVRISTRRREPLSYAVLALAIAAIFFSRSRSDGVAALVILILIALPTSRNPLEGRLRIIAVIILGALTVIPFLSGSRFLDAQGGASSTAGHITELEDGYRVLLYYPLGLGLGDQPDTATRFSATTKTVNAYFVSDNLVFQVGDELGFEALVPWLLMMGLILLELKRRAGNGDAFSAALGFGLLGIVIAGLYHQVFLTYPVPWTLWAGVGLACTVYAPYDAQDPAHNVYPAVAGVP